MCIWFREVHVFMINFVGDSKEFVVYKLFPQWGNLFILFFFIFQNLFVLFHFCIRPFVYWFLTYLTFLLSLLILFQLNYAFFLSVIAISLRCNITLCFSILLHYWHSVGMGLQSYFSTKKYRGSKRVEDVCLQTTPSHQEKCPVYLCATSATTTDSFINVFGSFLICYISLCCVFYLFPVLGGIVIGKIGQKKTS